MRSYVGLIHKEPDSDYGVSFPDFPGCVTAGATIEEARERAAEALAFHVDGMLQDGEPIPDPMAIDRVMQQRENRDAIAVLVPLPTGPARAVRVNVTIAEDVLADIDRYAAENGLTRSGLLVQASLRLIEGNVRINGSAPERGRPRSRRKTLTRA